MSDDFISDRLLERLALGEVPDDEAKRVLARLEANGEGERFEALIADNEAFFETYPPHVLAARIHQDARHRAPAIDPQENTMVAPSRSPVLAAIICAILTIGGGIAWLLTAAPEPPRNVAHTDEPIAAPTPIEVLEPPQAKVERVGTIHDRGARYPMPAVLYMQTEQVVSISAKGVKRVSFSNAKIIDAIVTDDVIYLTANKETGTGMVRIISKDDEVVSTMLTVGEPVDASAMDAAVASEHSLHGCGATAPDYEGVARITIVASVGGVHLGHAMFPGLDDSDADAGLRRCVEQTVAKWDIRPEPLSVGTLNFNFGAGAVCTPGEDC